MKKLLPTMAIHTCQRTQPTANSLQAHALSEFAGTLHSLSLSVIKTKLDLKTLLFLFFLIFCHVQTIYSQNIGHKLIIQENLDIHEIGKADWSYPWYMVKHEDGKFENTLGNPISPKDTIHIIHNSKCFGYKIIDGKKSGEPYSKLNFCEAELKNDTVLINIFNNDAFTSEYLKFKVIGGMYWVNYYETHVFQYEKIRVHIINHELTLNQESIEYGDNIKGKIQVELTVKLFYDSREESDFYHKIIEGTFEVKIK